MFLSVLPQIKIFSDDWLLKLSSSKSVFKTSKTIQTLFLCPLFSEIINCIFKNKAVFIAMTVSSWSLVLSEQIFQIKHISLLSTVLTVLQLMASMQLQPAPTCAWPRASAAGSTGWGNWPSATDESKSCIARTKTMWGVSRNLTGDRDSSEGNKTGLNQSCPIVALLFTVFVDVLPERLRDWI